MIRYFITDRRTAPLRESIEHAIGRGIERIQIREKDMSARELLSLISSIDRKQSKLLINGRMDIALGSGADGVHLPSNSPSPNQFRCLAPPGFLIAVSCHSVEDVLRAEAEGADFCVLGPIFATPSKSGEPLGLRVLNQAAHSSALPILALGGVTEANTCYCLRSGAVGIAGIRLFLGTVSMKTTEVPPTLFVVAS